MRRNIIETIMAAVVLLVAGVFVYFAYVTAQIGTATGYPITAKFFRVGGLSRGSDVHVRGIKVGTVSDVRLDAETYDAVVVMAIEPNVALPVDTVASIDSAGLFGGKVVHLEPGRSSEHLATGGEITNTLDFRSLEDQFSSEVFGGLERGATNDPAAKE